MGTMSLAGATLGVGLVSVLVATGAPVAADDGAYDWPQWRGPDRTGVSQETGWVSEGRAEPLWSVNVGLGYACVSVADGRAFTTGYDEEAERDRIFCFDAETGRRIWSFSCPAQIWANFHGGGTLTTPLVDGDVVYISNREGKLWCFRAADGVVVWWKDLAEAYGPVEMFHGYAGSPVVLGDQLIVSMGGKTIAMDKRNGAALWQTRNYGDGSYSTPATLHVDGRPYLAVLTGEGLAVLDRQSGVERWFHPWQSNSGGVNCATPVVLGDRVFISSAYQMGCAMLRLGDSEPEVVWQSKRMRNKMTGCVMWQDHLYGFDESILKCIDLDGVEQWRVRGLGMGALMIADGRLIVQSSRGELVIAEASPDEFRELARQKVLDGGVYWTSPVLAGGRVYCRNSLGDVVCLDHRAGAGVGALARTETPAGESLVELPEAGELFARHLAAIGGEEALRRHSSMQLTGSSVNLADGETGSVLTLSHAAPDRVIEKRDMGMYGAMLSCYDGTIGWIVNPWEGSSLAEGAKLEELRRRGDYFADAEWDRLYSSMRTTGVEEFDDRRCYVVEAKTSGGADRMLFFEIESGLMAGRQGSAEPVVMLTDYEAFDGLLIPTRRRALDAETGGEQIQTIDSVSFDTVESTAFDPPEPIRWLLMSPEEVEAANSAARQQHAPLLGRYKADDDDTPMGVVDVTVGEGRLAVQSPMGVWVLIPADGEDAWRLRDMGGMSVTFQRDESGAITSITLDGPSGPTVMKRQEGREGAEGPSD